MNQQETIDALAEQNRMLKEAMGMVCMSSLTHPRVRNYVEKVLALPDLSTSILNQRDARTLREAADYFGGDNPDSVLDITARMLRTMAAEKEK